MLSQSTEMSLLGFCLYFVSKVRKFLLVPPLSSACYGLGSLFPRIRLGNLRFSAQGLGSVSWKGECVRTLPFEGFTPVAVVEDEELRIAILEKDLQGDVLCRESTVTTDDPWNTGARGWQSSWQFAMWASGAGNPYGSCSPGHDHRVHLLMEQEVEAFFAGWEEQTDSLCVTFLCHGLGFLRQESAPPETPEATEEG